jgi:cellulose 1,4-beta-cellobiosidase
MGPRRIGLRRVGVVAALLLAGLTLGCGGGLISSGGQVTVPPVPTALTATAGNQQVGLTWAASSGASSYHVKRATSSCGPYTEAGSATATTYTDTGLTNGTTYFYVVSALNASGESANSSPASATPASGMPVVPVPAAPTALSATPGNQQVSLTWTASTGATSYHVKRATTSGGPYVQVGSASVTSYNDTGLTNGTTYFYVVSALNAEGESANSSQASGTPVAPAPGVPAVPTALMAIAANQQISLSWTASSGATSYHVKRATVSGGPYTQVSAPTSNGYLNTGLVNGTTYYFVVSALNASGESANSSPASATPSLAPDVTVTVDPTKTKPRTTGRPTRPMQAATFYTKATPS